MQSNPYISLKRRLLLCALATLCILAASAVNPGAKKLMILNSYNENEPWVSAVIQPLVLKLNQDRDIDCEIVNLNNALIPTEADFELLTNNLIAEYSDPAPSYVVMIGNMAFNMRHKMHDAWGEVPIVFITNTSQLISTAEYFREKLSFSDLVTAPSLETVRDSSDFTAIIIPEYYKQTVDMMVGLIPDMDELVFMSDSIYTNRHLALDIQRYLKDEYPQISFKWLKATQANSERLQDYLSEREPETGLLLSSWLYEKRSVNGLTIPDVNDLKLISASVNPIFALHQACVPMGCVGGVFPTTSKIQDHLMAMVDSMMAGADMRQMPFYYDEDSYPCINYRRLTDYGLDVKRCPEGTMFYNRPPSFWEKYMWETIAAIILVLLALGGMIKRNLTQRHKIEVLKRNKEFVNNMPIPYSTAQVLYDSDGQVNTIRYTVKNEAFDRLLEQNTVEGSPYLLFPASFIGPKVEALLVNNGIDRFIYHFENTDTYYEFIICQVNIDPQAKPILHKHKDKKRNKQIIDIFAIDITDQQKTATQLTDTTRKLDIAMSVTNMDSWIYDFRTDTITYENYERRNKYEWAQVKSHTVVMAYDEFLDRAHPDDRQMLFQLREDVRNKRIDKINLRFRKAVDPDNTRYEWYQMLGAVVEMDDEKNPLRVIGSNTNINESVMHQDEMDRALARANESDRLKSAFLASMSHEIRTPLNAIVGFSNVIAHTDSQQERLEFCDIINRNNEQLLSLINDVLDLAKIESNTVDINYVECDINHLIDNVERTMRPKVPGNVRFNIVKSQPQCLVEVDRTRLTQILCNMMSNACKFTPQGSITLGYEVTDHGMLYFYVRDTGVGLSRENAQKVFDRFFKLDSFVTGTGLGLSICKNLVEKMGGEIGVESGGEGKGSLFWFTVPYIPDDNGYQPEDEDDGYFKKNMSHLQTRLKVLIAEDNDSNYRLLAHLLKSTFDIARANNGEEAVELYKQMQPDVVLMDISMPGMDGYKAFDSIRLLSPTVPIIAVTAYVYASDRSKILDYGFNGYVAKPITQRAIIDAIGHAFA